MNRTPMKRSGFASQWKPRERTERTLSPIRAPAPSAGIFKSTPKHEYVRDRAYRMFVASQECFECGIEKISQAAHSNSGSDGKGTSIKSSDVALFPLCATTPGRIGCHEKHDLAKDGRTREQRRAKEVEWIERMEERAKLRAAGVTLLSFTAELC